MTSIFTSLLTGAIYAVCGLPLLFFGPLVYGIFLAVVLAFSLFRGSSESSGEKQDRLFEEAREARVRAEVAAELAGEDFSRPPIWKLRRLED